MSTPVEKYELRTNVTTGLNLSEVRLELANEEAADATSGIERGHDTTPSKFLVQGLDLEDQQYVSLDVMLS